MFSMPGLAHVTNVVLSPIVKAATVEEPREEAGELEALGVAEGELAGFATAGADAAAGFFTEFSL